MPSSEYDYIIIGAGSAGCVIARRLLDANAGRILLLEAGGDDTPMYLKMPAGVPQAMANHTWAYISEPQPETLNRPLTLAQGKVVGGSSSVNGMVYMRGHREDYDAWASEHGCEGWGYDDLLPYFIRSEGNESLSSEYHGNHGPLSVSENRYRHPLSMAFIRAAQQVGLPYTVDFNGAQQQGAGFYQTTTKNGERASTSQTYLKPVRSNPQLTLQTKALAQRLSIENGRATGLQYQHGGQLKTARARKEIIITAGALASPKLLMLSGIGPADHLKQHGIEILLDAPGVGENYQDHLVVPLDADLNAPISLMGHDRGWRAVSNALQWTLFRSGVLTSNIVECGAFFDTDGDGRSDIQLNALAASSCGWGDPLPQVHRFSLAPLCTTCHSRGQVRLRSANPDDLPRVYGNYLGAREEVDNFIHGIRLARSIMAAPALSRYLKGEALPGPNVDNSDQALEGYIRAKANTGLHPVGTCAMGTGADAVVDLELRVHGVDGLRVVDASIMPTIIRGNTAAPTIMIAERAAAFIKGESVQVTP